jgi:acetyltransferase
VKLALEKFLPPCWSRRNPIDILGDADVERYDKTIRASISDPNVDGIIPPKILNQ